MGKYKCEGCAIGCICEIPSECDFTPEGCLAKFEHLEPKWENNDDEELPEPPTTESEDNNE